MALTRTQAWDLFGKLLIIFGDIDNYGHVNSPNFTTRFSTAQTANAGIFVSGTQAALERIRANLSSVVTSGNVRDLIAVVFDEMLAAIGSPEAGNAAISLAQKFRRIYDDMIAGGYVLTSQAIVRGAASASGGNTGNGTIRRLTVGPDGYALEGSWPEVKTVVCVLDQSSVEKHREVFEWKGATRQPGLLNNAGSGIVVRTRCLTTRDSDDFGLVNPTFSSFAGTAPTASTPTAVTAVTDFSGWTLDSITSAYCTLDYAYRDFPTEPNAYSLEWRANNGIQQQFNSARILELPEFVPIYFQVAVYRASAADGVLTLTLGASTFVVADLTTLNNSAWNLVVMTIDKRLWLKNFTSNNLLCRVAWSGRTTGTLRPDDIILANPIPLDGGWVVPIGGSTPFKYGDTISFTDSVPTTRIGQISWVLNYRAQVRTDISLPCAPAAPSAPSAALAGAGAGNVDNGTHVYAVTVVSADSVEGPVGTSSASVNVADKTVNGKVSLTAIPTGPTGTTSRNVYRSAAGTTTPLKLLTTIAGNVTTTYTDNTADSGLGATVNSLIGVADPS